MQASPVTYFVWAIATVIIWVLLARAKSKPERLRGLIAIALGGMTTFVFYFLVGLLL